MTVTSSAIEPALEPVRPDELSVARARLLRRVARLLAGLGAILTGAIIRLGSLGDDRFRIGLDLGSIAPISSTLLFPLVGALILQRRPATRVAWLLVAMGISLGIGFVTFAYGAVGLRPEPPLPGALAAVIASQFFLLPALATGSTLLFLLFPTDRFLGPRWRYVIALSIVGLVAFLTATVLEPGSLDEDTFPGIQNPLGLPPAWSALTSGALVVGNTALLSAAVLSVVSLVLRYRSGDRVERAQIRWIALVGVFVAASFVVASLQLGWVSDRAWEVGFSFLSFTPIAIGIAITRYHLYEIDRLINRALVYGSLTAILAGIFTAGIGLAQRVFVATTGESSDAAIVGTTLVVATLYAPMRKRLEALVDRYFKYDELRFGAYRDEMERLLTLVEPTRAAQRLIGEAVRELGATGGAVVDQTEQPVATAGTWPVSAAVRLGLVGGGDLLTAVVIGPRLDGRPHDPVAIAQLDEIARLTVTAARQFGPVGPRSPSTLSGYADVQGPAGHP